MNDRVSWVVLMIDKAWPLIDWFRCILAKPNDDLYLQNVTIEDYCLPPIIIITQQHQY